MTKRDLLLIPIIICIIASGFLASCITEKKRAKICQTCPVRTHDSIIEVVKDSLIEVKIPAPYKVEVQTEGDSLCALFCDSARKIINGKYYSVKGNTGVKTSFYSDKGKLVIKHENDSLKACITYLERSKTKTQIKTITVEEKCKKNHQKWFDSFCRWFTLIALIFLCVRTAFRYVIKKVI